MSDSPAFSSSFFSPLPDFPAWEKDLLEHKDLQDLIHCALLTAEAPQVLAVEGPWGSGKTGLLHRLYNDFEGDCPQNPGFPQAIQETKATSDRMRRYSHVRVIWFEAWRYQHEEKPVVALLYEIRRQLEEGRKQAVLFKLFSKEKDITLLTTALDNLGTALDIATKYLTVAAVTTLEPSTATIALAGKALSGLMRHMQTKDKNAPACASSDIRNALNTAISTYLTELVKVQNPSDKKKYGPPKPRLIIMVDDLDRCEPATAFRLLEGIKTWLDLPSCVFLLGINRRELRRTIASQLPAIPSISLVLQADKNGIEQRKADRAVNARADEYLEKLCHHHWPLPLPDTWERVGYLKQCLKTLPPEILAAVEKLLPTPPTDEETKAKSEPGLLLPPNPRRIKAIANRFRYLLGRRHSQLDHDSLACAWFTAATSVLNSGLYRSLQDKPSLIGPLVRFTIKGSPENDLPEHVRDMELPFSCLGAC